MTELLFFKSKRLLEYLICFFWLFGRYAEVSSKLWRDTERCYGREDVGKCIKTVCWHSGNDKFKQMRTDDSFVLIKDHANDAYLHRMT